MKNGKIKSYNEIQHVLNSDNFSANKKLEVLDQYIDEVLYLVGDFVKEEFVGGKIPIKKVDLSHGCFVSSRTWLRSST